ncbi:hypothetical protein BGZ65_005655 [Modicella reniformis]|uniref:Uncharacterized protein n=1 Tax=Modicella reniformis TaxID=1440133 RepID=A0A9P6J6Y0_9FUNG|nr:hypothetical protein BGZ65_005655 [Modicella reniformis]
MPSDISIFDIPHITEGIGSYLNRPDMASCTLVDKCFYESFKRLLWRELVYEVSSESKQIKNRLP